MKEVKQQTDSQKPKQDKEKAETFFDNETEKATSNSDNSRVETSRNKTGHKRKNTAGAIKKKRNAVRSFLNIIQALGSIATVAMAILAWRTLVEMQTERTNAYQPEIVITPNIFEGKIYEKFEDNIDKEYLIFDIDEPDSGNSINKSNHVDGKLVFLEKPYLTLKNIGKGTAKDVQVKFSVDWTKSVITLLNDNIPDDYSYKMKHHNEVYQYARYRLEYSDDSEPRRFDTVNKTVKRITYIESGEDSIYVYLPDNWYYLLELLYSQKYRLNEKKETGESSTKYYEHLEIPDLTVTINCLDIQGKPHEQTIIIPWDGYYSYTVYPESAEMDENFTLNTRFYGGYLR